MSARTTRRQAARHHSVSTVQVGANRIFKKAGFPNLLPIVCVAVDLNHAILQRGHLLATLHVLRLIRDHRPLPALSSGKGGSAWQSMLDQCYSAVSHATGPRCEQFKPDKDPELTHSLIIFNEYLQRDAVKPERPTWLKPVSCWFNTQKCLWSWLASISLTSDACLFT